MAGDYQSVYPSIHQITSGTQLGRVYMHGVEYETGGGHFVEDYISVCSLLTLKTTTPVQSQIGIPPDCITESICQFYAEGEVWRVPGHIAEPYQ